MAKNRNRNQPSTTTVEKDVSMNTEQNTTSEQEKEPENVAEEVKENSVVDQPENQEPVEQPEEKPAEAVVEQPAVQKTKPIEKGFTPVYKTEFELNNYATAMDKSKSIIPEEGGKWQHSLYMLIKGTLNVPEQETFNQEWNTILQFFNKNKDGIFNEKFIFRFPEQWTGSATEFTSFRRLVYTIIQTADPKSRKKVLESINFDMVAEGLTEVQRNKLISFYQI